jgi:arsenite methyltransferase
MFEEKIANNLKKPIGIFGSFIGKLLKENLIEYKKLETLISFSRLKDVLEIGYGPGYGMKYYSKRHACNLEGVDFSETMFKTASRRNRVNIKNGRIRLFCADFENWIIDEKTYDLVFLLNVIYFWEETENKIRKIYRLLNKKGQIAIFMTSPKQMNKSKVMRTNVFNKHEIQTVLALMKKTGFQNIEIFTPFDNKEFFFLLGEK